MACGEVAGVGRILEIFSREENFSVVDHSMMHLLPEKDRTAVYDKFVYESGRAATEIGFWFLDPRGASKVDESKVTCPVLIVAGSEDRITPVSVVRKVADKYGRVSTYKEFENHAHWAVGEPGWEEIAQFVSDWLNQTFSTSPHH